MKTRRYLFVPLAVVLLGTGRIPSQTLLRETHPGDDFTVREEMVPMRDGVRLFTVILTPKNARGPLPILLERTPYDASRILEPHSTRLAVTLGPKYLGHDYVFVAQDLRGRFRSEGDYHMYRVPRGAFNRTETDESTDAWDAIDWLVRTIPSNSGKVGVWGTSYPGWLTLAAMRDPHPALAAAVPFNPVVDVWKADDWFHWGAFRAAYAFDFIYQMETRKDQFTPYPYETRDMYSWLLARGSVADGLGSRLDERHKMWRRLMANPAYGPYWKDCAADQWFASPSRVVPALHVHGWWDQEDIYGSPAVYAALEKHDRENSLNFFAAGPWYHGQHWQDGSRLGSLSFEEDTSKRFREDVLAPFLRRFLTGEKAAVSPATVFETGTNRWRRFERWPPSAEAQKLYLLPGGSLGFSPPTAPEASTEYLSDPARPVPNTPRPHWGFNYDEPLIIAAWRRWLVEDQRFVDGRPDVATWVGEPLAQPVTVRGGVTAQLFAETTGTDADWVVKLIDVFPDEAPGALEMSGYELMISADIFRGRYRESLEEARPLAADRPLAYTIPLPHVNHRFNAGHRIMVQVQSSWFPLYDRNPQTFVPSVMTAPPSSYKAQRHRIHHSATRASHLVLLVDRDGR